MQCLWCNEDKVRKTTRDGYWVLPDGARTVEILIEDEINEMYSPMKNF